jgi:tetratricopeptide (TPR) repeat protein
MKIIMTYLFFAMLFFTSSVEASKHTRVSFKADMYAQKHIQIDSLIQQSNNYLRSDLKKSLSYALRTLEASSKQDNKNNQMLAYEQLGKVYYYIGMFDKCYENWQKARELAVEISDELKISNTTFNLVALLIVIKDYDNANLFPL